MLKPARHFPSQAHTCVAEMTNLIRLQILLTITTGSPESCNIGGWPVENNEMDIKKITLTPPRLNGLCLLWNFSTYKKIKYLQYKCIKIWIIGFNGKGMLTMGLPHLVFKNMATMKFIFLICFHNWDAWTAPVLAVYSLVMALLNVPVKMK